MQIVSQGEVSRALTTADACIDNRGLKELLAESDPHFFTALGDRTRHASSFEDVIFLSTLRRRAREKGVFKNRKTLRLAVLGGCNLYPLHEIIEHFIGFQYDDGMTDCELFVGNYDNYVAEIVEESSSLYQFNPEIICVIPHDRLCRYPAALSDPRNKQEAQANQIVQHLLQLCQTAHDRSGAEIIFTNFAPPCRFDPGPYRTRSLGSDWSFGKRVNLEFGLVVPSYVHICDVDFLSCRRGTLHSSDPRGWFETKQPWAPDLIVDVAREIGQIVSSLRRGPKKVVVLDLDNTLWGGVIGDDGVEGIELGDTSPRGEAFKSFQKFLRSLTDRGIVLAVCSKNDHERAVEPFEKHPDMVLRMEDIVSFKANWQPKSDNIREIAAELGLGLDSFVFVDDNPAEIEIVKQFVPEVTGILLGPDPSEYVGILQDSRLFEPNTITAEDATRVNAYKTDSLRQALLSSATDMDEYLRSLEMTATIVEFLPTDVPRIAQLINKSNQFNLTTRRRTVGEVEAIRASSSHVAFTMRLMDRFGDHGLIAVLIGEVTANVLEIDTWLMSCRVLKRQVEEEIVNEILRLATLKGCKSVRGVYIETEKNGMVRDLYPRLGFQPISVRSERATYEMETGSHSQKQTHIRITRRSYEPN